MPRAPLPPLVVGDRTIPLAYPPLATRLSLVSTWSRHIPDGAEEAPLAVQHLLTFAALGLAVEAGGTGALCPSLVSHGHDFIAYGATVAEALDGDAIDGPDLLRQADTVAGALISSTMAPKATAVQATADFSEAESVPASSPASAPPTAGSALPSPGAT